MSEFNAKEYLYSLLNETQKTTYKEEIAWLIEDMANEVEEGFRLEEEEQECTIRILKERYVNYSTKRAELEIELYLGLLDSEYQEDGWTMDYGHYFIYKTLIKNMLREIGDKNKKAS